ncbi:Phosphatidylinositol-4-phosphate 5-kinase [Vermiconidia calcicola]|uniref:Phosphatidylinositol-4-phosphate 5-kinase n=1 Tax=Vermiconidia calcicola TaxID=1690605 RepID=A0ACC3MH47_9PEZI|nr:Phosphatidylinositol-4-phosphate 5-kinase [Vermiconidia calcicola]
MTTAMMVVVENGNVGHLYKSQTTPNGLQVPPQLPPVTPQLSPVPGSKRRNSLQVSRRTVSLDDVPEDEDAHRWSEHIKEKRVSRRTGRQDTQEDDSKVLVGTKVDEGHVNYITAYNMLTGIRFTVSRTNAKVDRELSDADFAARHKFSFDITGNELTPSAKYDFKFKDYAPWVFRHLRAKFDIDPAEYLMSLTSKYILSELGSPGKSGSFFYFSRDYKYIIKTIHHAEHCFLRKVLKDYYQHVEKNPNTLLSQFYGLHRVKMPYGRKIHFVVMNNLFPPHRDIHGTYDLKGSTMGRDYDESKLQSNPRATLKDLNWLRRDMKLEFGPHKKDIFIRQMEKDVALLQKLKIMDYSLLVGIHDLSRGNEDGLRDKTLQVFQPGLDKNEENPQGSLIRTPSKLEHARRVRELRESVKKERPVPMEAATDIMPDEANRTGFFYKDDGGFRATNLDNTAGPKIYYLGIIDCLTRYNTVKKAEHFWKGMGGHEPEISPIPPQRYGERFIRFIERTTKSSDLTEKERESADGAPLGAVTTSPIDTALPAISESPSLPR